MVLDQKAQKQRAAKAALDYIKPGTVLGVGSGSTVDCFVDALVAVKAKVEGAVAASEATAKRLKAIGIPVLDLNSVTELPLYVDGADEVNAARQLIKGGGGALTREKIVAAAANTFVCIADQSKYVDLLGHFPLALEVIPMARSFVARQMVRLGGHPVYRQGFVTDNGNVIIDVAHLPLVDPRMLEEKINNITGVVANGLFAMKPADTVLLAMEDGQVKIL